MLAATFAIAEPLGLGHSWASLQRSTVQKPTRTMPALFIFFAIGMIIGSRNDCGEDWPGRHYEEHRHPAP